MNTESLVLDQHERLANFATICRIRYFRGGARMHYSLPRHDIHLKRMLQRSTIPSGNLDQYEKLVNHTVYFLVLHMGDIHFVCRACISCKRKRRSLNFKEPLNLGIQGIYQYIGFS